MADEDEISELRDEVQRLSGLVNMLMAQRTAVEDHGKNIQRIFAELWGQEDSNADIGSSSGSLVIGSNVEPPEAGYTGSWPTNVAGQGLDLWVSVGDAYYEAGSKTLYGYKGRLRIGNGKIYAFDSLTRYTIDVPTP